MKKFWGILLSVSFLIFPYISPASLFNMYEVYADDALDTQMELVEFDAFGLDEDGISRKYAKLFEGADIELVMDGRDQEYIPMLRKFDFNSLNLRLEFEDRESMASMQCIRGLLFPEMLQSVTITCEGKEALYESDAFENFIICLWVCCPDAVLNGTAVRDLAKPVFSEDQNNLAEILESDAKLHYVFDMAVNGKLEISDADPEYTGKLIFYIFDTADLSSVESMKYGEPFYSVPDLYLADDFDEADTLVFIFPYTSVIGEYSNGGQAVSTFTRVCAVNMHTMEMYAIYTAVRNDPPESIEIMLDNGAYSTDGAQGAYEPKEALNQILLSGKIKSDAKKEWNNEIRQELLPWLDKSSIPVQDGSAEEDTEPDITGQLPRIIELTASKSGDKNDTSAEKSVTDVYDWLTADLLERIFELLDDDTYSKTYNLLKTSKDLTNGSKGELVLGFQKTLIGLGQNIAADSVFGNATLTAFYQAADALGISRTNKISSKLYAALMPALLINLNEDAASKLLEDMLSGDGGSEYEYLKGCVMCMRGKYYNARNCFENSRFGDYEDRALACVQDMPATGQVYKNNELTGSESSLTVSINSYDESAATCVLIYNSDDQLVSCLLIRGSSNAMALLKAGRYRIVDGTGYRWYGVRDMFGEDGTYETIIFDDGTDTLDIQSGYDYTITFNVQEHSDASIGLGSEDIGWEDAQIQ